MCKIIFKLENLRVSGLNFNEAVRILRNMPQASGVHGHQEDTLIKLTLNNRSLGPQYPVSLLFEEILLYWNIFKFSLVTGGRVSVGKNSPGTRLFTCTETQPAESNNLNRS